MSEEKHTCCASVRIGDTYQWRECGCKANSEVNGNHFCGRHNPLRIAERRKKTADQRSMKFDARIKQMNKARADYIETQRRAEQYPKLVEALKDAREFVELRESTYQSVTSTGANIRAALKQAGEME